MGNFAENLNLGNRVRPPPPVQMLLFPNALCCSLYECNWVCADGKIFTKFLPANNFCQLLRVTRRRSCTSAGNAQAQLPGSCTFGMINRGRLELATSAIISQSSPTSIPCPTCGGIFSPSGSKIHCFACIFNKCITQIEHEITHPCEQVHFSLYIDCYVKCMAC